jgi:hypothetical protein
MLITNIIYIGLNDIPASYRSIIINYVFVYDPIVAGSSDFITILLIWSNWFLFYSNWDNGLGEDFDLNIFKVSLI